MLFRKRSAVPASVRCCELLQHVDLLALFAIFFLSVVDISILALRFCGEAVSKPSKLMILTSCAELLSSLLCQLSSRSTIQSISARNTSIGENVIYWTDMSLDHREEALLVRSRPCDLLFRFSFSSNSRERMALIERDRIDWETISFLNYGIKEEREGRKVLFILL